MQSEVGNLVLNGALESSRFVQNLVARHGNPAVRCVQYRVGYRRANGGNAAVAAIPVWRSTDSNSAIADIARV
jgi:hypothetical protein